MFLVICDISNLDVLINFVLIKKKECKLCWKGYQQPFPQTLRERYTLTNHAPSSLETLTLVELLGTTEGKGMGAFYASFLTMGSLRET